jgi:hypothetical protein
MGMKCATFTFEAEMGHGLIDTLEENLQAAVRICHTRPDNPRVASPRKASNVFVANSEWLNGSDKFA